MSSMNNNYRFNSSENKDKYGYFQLWKKPPDEPETETIIRKSNKNQTKIRNLTEVLNEDFSNMKNIFHEENTKEEEIKSKTKLTKNISTNVNKILKNVGKIVSNIKDSQEKLSEINMESLFNTKKKIIKSEKLDEPNNLVKKKEKEYKNQLKLNKKNKKLYNYQFLSDYYRRQLNKVLLNFNPIKHLENINLLRKENPQINEEFNEKTKKIEGEIFHKTSPNFFQKNSSILQKTFYKNTDNNIAINTNTNINFFPNKNKSSSKNKNPSLPKVANFTSMGFHPVYKCYATEADVPKNIKSQKKINLYNYNPNFNLKRNKIRKFPDKEGRKLELELMENVCKNMINSINRVENDENDFYNNFAKLNSDERQKMKDYFLKDKSDAEKILLNIKNNNLLKGIKDDIFSRRKKINDDIKNYGKKMNNIRDEIISNIEQQESIEHDFII